MARTDFPLRIKCIYWNYIIFAFLNEPIKMNGYAF